MQNVEKCADEIPVEKIAVLTQWVDDLQSMHNINSTLKGLYETWKKANKGTMASVASDQPGSDDALTQPESEKSSTAESKLPAPTAKTPATKVSETSVVSNPDVSSVR